MRCDAGAPQSRPSSLGARPHRLVVLDDGTRVGTLGRHALDAELVARASELIDARTTGVDCASRASTGRPRCSCRSTRRFLPLVVVGATDVAAALVQLAKPLGFNTTVIDGRDRWANSRAIPDGRTRCWSACRRSSSPTFRSRRRRRWCSLSHDFKYDLAGARSRAADARRLHWRARKSTPSAGRCVSS